MQTVLVTGATGFVGKAVIGAILRDSTAQVVLLIRAKDGKTVDERCLKIRDSALLADVGTEFDRRVRSVDGDIESENLGLSVQDLAWLRRDVDTIVHCAASVDFDRALADAYRTNTKGALEALAVAKIASARLVYISTAYVTPHQDAPIPEELAFLPIPAPELAREIESGAVAWKTLKARTGHSNTYTLTKCLAEHLLVHHADGVALQIVRPSVVSACRRYPEPGCLEGSSGLNGVIRLYGSGLLKTMVFCPKAKLDVVPCDDVAHDILECLNSAEPDQRIIHSVGGEARSIPLDQLSDGVIEFYRDKSFVFRPYPVSTETRMGLRFWLVTFVFHQAPWTLVALALLCLGRRREASKAWQLVKTMTRLGSSFGYFSRRTFRFIRKRPPFEFEATSYMRLVIDGVTTHLIKPFSRATSRRTNVEGDRETPRSPSPEQSR